MRLAAVKLALALFASLSSLSVGAKEGNDARFRFDTFLVPDPAPDEFMEGDHGVWVSGRTMPSGLARITKPVEIMQWGFSANPGLVVGMATGDVPVGCSLNRTKKGRTHVCFADPEKTGSFTEWFILGDEISFSNFSHNLASRNPKPVAPIPYVNETLENIGVFSPDIRFEIRHMAGRLEVCRTDALCSHAGPKIDKSAGGEVSLLGGKFRYATGVNGTLRVKTISRIQTQIFLFQRAYLNQCAK